MSFKRVPIQLIIIFLLVCIILNPWSIISNLGTPGHVGHKEEFIWNYELKSYQSLTNLNSSLLTKDLVTNVTHTTLNLETNNIKLKKVEFVPDLPNLSIVADNFKIALDSESVFKSGAQFKLQNDSKLLDFIRQNHLFPPSPLPYNLKHKAGDPTEKNGQEWKVVLNILHNMTNGFFVECGANDGEFLSNTLVLERDYGWTGLLVEADPRPLKDLFKKNRKAWIANTCLSTTTYPKMVTMKRHDSWQGVGIIEDANDPRWNEWDYQNSFTVKCLPFFSILSALNVSTIDFFSLDVEQAELPILKTIPFDMVSIKVFAIELFPTRAQAVIDFLKQKNYKLVKHIEVWLTNDYIFVHKSIYASNNVELKTRNKIRKLNEVTK